MQSRVQSMGCGIPDVWSVDNGLQRVVTPGVWRVECKVWNVLAMNCTCHTIYTLSPLGAEIPIRLATNTQHDVVSKVLPLLQHKGSHLPKTAPKYLPHKTTFDTSAIMSESESHQVPRFPHEMACQDLQHFQT